MTSRIGSITFDCEHPLVLSEFWAQVVGRAVSAGPPEPREFFAAIPPGDDGSPMMMFRKWSEAVLGPDAASFGEHHRTITLRY